MKTNSYTLSIATMLSTGLCAGLHPAAISAAEISQEIARSASPKILKAFVTIPPQRLWVQRLAGVTARVDVLVPTGQDPHTYEPTAQLINNLAHADVYIRIGMPLEDVWLAKMQAVNPHMDVVDLSAGLNLKKYGEGSHPHVTHASAAIITREVGVNPNGDVGGTHPYPIKDVAPPITLPIKMVKSHHAHCDDQDNHNNHDGDVHQNKPAHHEHGMGADDDHTSSDCDKYHGADPHIWTSPPLVRQMVIKLRDYLVQHDPAQTAFYQANYEAFIQDLDVLDRDIKNLLTSNGGIGGVPHTSVTKPCRFMVFHPAWGHFADAYDLEQVAIEQHGKSPGAKTLGTLIEQAKQWHLRVIFAQPQFDRKTVATLAAAIGGRVEIIDPLAENYFDSLRKMGQLVAESCQQ